MKVTDELIKDNWENIVLQRCGCLVTRLGLEGKKSISWDAHWDKGREVVEMIIYSERRYSDIVLSLNMGDRVASLLAYYDDYGEGAVIKDHQAFRMPEDVKGLGEVMDDLIWGR